MRRREEEGGEEGEGERGGWRDEKREPAAYTLATRSLPEGRCVIATPRPRVKKY